MAVLRHDDERSGLSQAVVGQIVRERAEALAEVDRLRQRCAEADSLLRTAYADAHPEDVPMDVLTWLNPEV